MEFVFVLLSYDCLVSFQINLVYYYIMNKTVDKKCDLRTFCRWSNLSRFTRFWGDQSNHKFAVGGPQLILRAGAAVVRNYSHGIVSRVYCSLYCQKGKVLFSSLCFVDGRTPVGFRNWTKTVEVACATKCISENLFLFACDNMYSETDFTPEIQYMIY